MTSRDQYIHRIGRTGRAGKEGDGVILCFEDEENLLRKELSDLPLVVRDLHNFTLTTSADMGLSTVQQTQSQNIQNEFSQKVSVLVNQIRNGQNQELFQSAQQAWGAWLGFYNGYTKKFKWTPRELVATSATFSTSLGLIEMPSLPKRTLAKMGLLKVEGLRAEEDQRGGGGSRQGSGNGGGGGGGRNGNNNNNNNSQKFNNNNVETNTNNRHPSSIRTTASTTAVKDTRITHSSSSQRGETNQPNSAERRQDNRRGSHITSNSNMQTSSTSMPRQESRGTAESLPVVFRTMNDNSSNQRNTQVRQDRIPTNFSLNPGSSPAGNKRRSNELIVNVNGGEPESKRMSPKSQQGSGSGGTSIIKGRETNGNQRPMKSNR